MASYRYTVKYYVELSAEFKKDVELHRAQEYIDSLLDAKMRTGVLNSANMRVEYEEVHYED